jgi:hypothetical protein
VADEKADELPQAHNYRIGLKGTSDIPRRTNSHEIHTSEAATFYG